MSKQSVVELIREGFPILRSVKEIIETAGILSVPLDEKITHLFRLQKGQKVETFTDERFQDISYVISQGTATVVGKTKKGNKK